jgi:hypothetical protein
MAESLTNVDQFLENPSEGGGGGGGGGGSTPVTPVTPAPPTDVNPPIPVNPPSLPPVSPAPPERPTVNLLSGITINKLDIHSIYTKGSGIGIPSESFVITNTFPDLIILVTMVGLVGVTFEPGFFYIHPNESVEVVVSFDHTQIENLPEGVSTLTVDIELSSTLPTYQPPPVVTPPTDPIPVIFWINGLDGSYNVGNPPFGWHQAANGMWLPAWFPVDTPVDPTPPPIVVDPPVFTPPPPQDVTPSIPVNPPIILPPVFTPPPPQDVTPSIPVNPPFILPPFEPSPTPAPADDPVQPHPIFTPPPPQDTRPSIPIDLPQIPIGIPEVPPAPVITPIPEPMPEPLPPPPEPPFDPPLYDDPDVPFRRFRRPAE